jgi:uncharacterized glyoxalase superfamily protein PhnB
MNNRSMPASTVIPVLGYPDIHAASNWLCGAFGFAERLRIFDHRIQLSVGDGHVVITDIAPHAGADAAAHTPARGVAIAPDAIDRQPAMSVMIRVPDVDAHCARARAYGADIVLPPERHPFGEKQYTVADHAGYRWTFSETIDDVDPAAWGGVMVGADGGASQQQP